MTGLTRSPFARRLPIAVVVLGLALVFGPAAATALPVCAAEGSDARGELGDEEERSETARAPDAARPPLRAQPAPPPVTHLSSHRATARAASRTARQPRFTPLRSPARLPLRC